ncbi:MAG TPA: hypothetical protein VGU72_04285 [Beijerinckiaceae bacterium]|jgi:hypothetical protein|nr:hypothetical protein [Beijerinckiaceae bacterium]
MRVWLLIGLIAIPSAIDAQPADCTVERHPLDTLLDSHETALPKRYVLKCPGRTTGEFREYGGRRQYRGTLDGEPIEGRSVGPYGNSFEFRRSPDPIDDMIGGLRSGRRGRSAPLEDDD